MAVKRENKLFKEVDRLQRKCEDEVMKILTLAWLKRKGSFETPLSYSIDPRMIDLVVDRLAGIILDLKLKRKPDLGKVFAPMFKVIKPEIEKIYSTIKTSVGFSARRDRGLYSGDSMDEERWQKAALDCFDDSKKGWQAIKREYLEDKNLYCFTSGQERRDFEGRLLKKILEDNDLGSYGAQTLRKFYVNINIE